MKDDTLIIVGAILVVLIVVGIFIAQPAFEANTFNRLTNGPEATYWDAVFSNLRITGCN